VTDEPQAIDPRLRVDEFDYDLPPALIAQVPLVDRGASRLLVLERDSDGVHHSFVRDLARWLTPGDLLVVNNSRVIAARLVGTRVTGGRAELLLLRREATGLWSALGRPARRLRPGTRVEIAARTGSGVAVATIVEQRVEGELLVALDPAAESALDQYGSVPLPPYITTPLTDAERYQTVYASTAGSAAAPTAGLHFTDDLISELTGAGIGWAEVTLHIGLDTFRPVTVNRVADHTIHQEWCSVSTDVAQQVAAAKRSGMRVVAVGTTAARTLESLGQQWNIEKPTGFSGMTGIFITPGYRWQIVDALLTNFHLPRSTLLMMVSALAGREHIRHAYAEAIAERYRFYSFGDAMLIR
jgi:S-adenosylmethionine:tRNA ribosyltransferase-isomerase